MRLNTKEIAKLCKGKKLSQIEKLLCGDFIGAGCYRRVYELKQNKDYVVKIEPNPSYGIFANVTEFRNYINYREWKWFSNWLAPCELINETGQILIQKRVEHKTKKEYPKYIPSMFTDTKYTNFGWIGKQFVCCDYSFIPFYIIKSGNDKMKKAKWWSHKIKRIKK